MAPRAVLAELVHSYQTRSQQAVLLESLGGVTVAERVRAGQPLDLVALSRDAIDLLLGEGHLVATSAVDFAHSSVAVAVRMGVPQPDVTSVETLQQAVLEARSVGISTGPSGQKLTLLFRRWGIAGRLAGRIIVAPPGEPVAQLLARGEVELGFQQLPELVKVDGIQVVGVLPAPVQIRTTFSVALSNASVRVGAARGLLSFLTSPDAAHVKRRWGMDPALPDAAIGASA